MNDENPTAIIKMIQKLKSDSNSERTSSVNINSSSISSNSTFNTSEREEYISPKRQRLDSSTFSNDISTHQSAPTSPWEWKKLRGEVVSLRTRISQQDAHIQQLHNIRRQMEEMLENEKSMLKAQSDQDKQMIKQLELRLDVGKRTIQDLRESKIDIEREFQRTRMRLEKEIATLKESAIKSTKDDKRELKEKPEKDILKDNLEKENAELKQQVKSMKERIEELQVKVKDLLNSQKDFELQNIELQNAKMNIEKLGYERIMWEEGKQLSSKAAKAIDLEKELTSAKEIIAALRESVKGKLLLEEQMMSVKKRLEHTERLEQQVAVLQTSQSELLAKLNEYESIGISGGPTVLKRELNRLQQAELLLMTEESQLKSKVDSIQKECNNLIKKYEEAKKLASEMASSSEKSNRLMSRLQKKMILVSRERDSYRQQLDAYEKENSTDGNNSANEKISALESTLHGYRELIGKLEADLEAADGIQLREECTRLRNEVSRLQLEFEHRALKGDFNCDLKVLHYTINPAAMAEIAAQEKQMALQKELETLREKVAKGIVGDVGISTLQAQEIEEMKQSYEIKTDRLKEAFKASTQEFRQACYLLFGWRIDRTKEGMYKLSSQYAESPEDHLCFQLTNGDEELLLLETAFSATLNDFIERHLHIQKSVPMFLSAVQTELFSQQTMTMMMG